MKCPSFSLNLTSPQINECGNMVNYNTTQNLQDLIKREEEGDFIMLIVDGKKYTPKQLLKHLQE